MLLDASAWIELFKGGSLGDRVSSVIQAENCHTCIVTVAEVAQWAEGTNQDPDNLIDHIEKLSDIVNLDREIATLAGRLNLEARRRRSGMGMMDSLILATGTVRGETILTTDQDFNGLPGAEILKG